MTCKARPGVTGALRVLRRCGATWDAAQSHGLLSGRLAIAGVDSGFDWLQQVLDGTDPADALRGECEMMLSQLFETTYRQLAERQSAFELLLPDGARERHALIGILTFGRVELSGERVWGSDRVLGLMFGPVLDETRPIRGGARAS